MANFNEKINFGTGFILRDQESNCFIQKSDSMEEFERNIDCLQFRKDPYRLYIQYKDAHPVESMAGHCFRWECVSKTRKRANVRCLDYDSNDYFGDPRFDSIAGAIFITDKYIVTYGDTWIDAAILKKEYVVCKAYVCGRFVSEFKIPAEVFDRFCGLKENFPDQYEKVFGKVEDAKPVQEENDLIEEAERKVELCKNSLYLTKQVIDRAVDLMRGAIIEIEDRSDQAVELIQGALIDIEGRKFELDNLNDILSSLDDTPQKLK